MKNNLCPTQQFKPLLRYLVINCASLKAAISSSEMFLAIVMKTR